MTTSDAALGTGSLGAGSLGAGSLGAGSLGDAAWGRAPGCWPLPEATGCREQWERAVALGGQGRYSAACAELDGVDRGCDPSPALRSAMASTRASWARQMGGHLTAARYDGQAIALIGFGSPRESGSDVIRARCDALTGLAADALGVGRFGVADAMLGRCEVELAVNWGSEVLWRQRLRLAWVRAELAMVSGNGSAALRHALDARELATEIVSLRHRTKTELIFAAALSSVGDVERALAVASDVLDACSEHGLLPLQWAAAMLSTGLGEVETSPAIVAETSALLARRGGVLQGV